MESLTDDETFFQGIAKIDDSFFLKGIKNLESNEKENFFEGDLDNPEKNLSAGKENIKTFMKLKPIKSPIPEEIESQLATENKNESFEEVKRKRTPLKTLNTIQSNTKNSKNTKPKEPKVFKKTSLTTEEKKSLKTDKESNKTKSTSDLNTKKGTTKRKSIKKENESGIIIYEDSPKTEVQNTVVKETNLRASFPEKKQPTVIILPRNRKFRYSLDEFNGDKYVNDKKPKTESVPPINLGFDMVKVKPLSKPMPTVEEIEKSVQKLETMFPTVDPEYLKAQYIKLRWSLQDTIEILLPKEDTGELPSREDYVKRKETEKLHNKYWENFTIENYLKLIPDPWQYFLEAEKNNCYKYANHSFHFLKNKFKKHYSQVLQEVFIRNDYSLYLTCQELKKKNRMLKMRATNRPKAECDAGKPTTFEIQFLHEVALVEHETQIKAYLKKEEALKLKRYQMAEKNGELYQCLTCKDYLLPFEDDVSCSANHVFCVDCVVRLVKVEISGDDFHFKCLKPCKERFSKYLLHEKLGPLLMATTIRRMQAERYKPDGIENLVSCPFCYYIMVSPPGTIMRQCLNPLCLLEFCRFCKQPSQTHSKCTESEKHELDKTEKKSIDPFFQIGKHYRKCFYCNKEFVQENDVDAVQITCSCGAVFCSICRQPFPECEHLIDKDFEASTEFDGYYCNDNNKESRGITTNFDKFTFDTPTSESGKYESDYGDNQEAPSITATNYDYKELDFNTSKTEISKYLSSDEDYVEATDSLCF